MIVLGLDISTSITGYTILDNEKIVEIGHIDFKNANNLWEKADHAKIVIDSLVEKYSPEKIYIEESLMGFSSGLSSAGTLFTLAKFNALISYILYLKIGKPVEFISAAHARKTVGIKLLQKKKCGKSHKEQAFEWCISGPLVNYEFPKTKTGKWKNFVYDEVDSFVIALAASKINN